MEERRQILISNEDDIFCGLCAHVLHAEGCETRFVERDGRRIADAICSDPPDAALFDAFLPVLDGLGVIETARERVPGLQTKFAVVTSAQSDFLHRQLLLAGASYCFVRPLQAETVAARLLRLCGAREDAAAPMEETAAQLLHRLGVPAHLNGYAYLREAVLLCTADASFCRAITKRLYPAIAARFGTTSARVERAMRGAIETAWERGDIEVLEAYFGSTVDAAKGKPTNGEFLAMLSERLRMEARRRAVE